MRVPHVPILGRGIFVQGTNRFCIVVVFLLVIPYGNPLFLSPVTEPKIARLQSILLLHRFIRSVTLTKQTPSLPNSISSAAYTCRHPLTQFVHVDISHYSFEEFVGFLFDRDVPPISDIPSTAEERALRWYYRTRTTIDPEKIIGHYIQLFSHPRHLLEQFSKDQLERGFSAMQSMASFSIRTLIWNQELAFELRGQCVRSMFYLFQDFFSIEPLRYTANMWWDGLCYVWEMGRKDRARGGEDSAMQDVMFETMAEILSIDSQQCRFAALHGLHHLHHPATLELIQRYAAIFPDLKNWCNRYAAEQAAWRERLEMKKMRVEFSHLLP
jgi:hypothetical protein